MSIKYSYNNETERLNIITELNKTGYPSIHNEKKKYYEQCEEDEIIVNGKIVKNKNCLQEYKDNCISDLKQYNENKIYETYPITRQIDIVMGIRESIEEMKAFINKHLNAYNQVKDNINKIPNIEELKKYDYINNYLELLEDE